jgi:hypothetical protein
MGGGMDGGGMDGSEVLFAAGLGLAGLVACTAIYLGKHDPETAPYLPTITAEFQLGRVRMSPDPSQELGNRGNQKDKKDESNDQQGKQ